MHMDKKEWTNIIKKVPKWHWYCDDDFLWWTSCTPVGPHSASDHLWSRGEVLDCMGVDLANLAQIGLYPGGTGKRVATPRNSIWSWWELDWSYLEGGWWSASPILFCHIHFTQPPDRLGVVAMSRPCQRVFITFTTMTIYRLSWSLV